METIGRNSSGEKVLDIQRRLKLLGYELGTSEIDGILVSKPRMLLENFSRTEDFL